MKPVLYISLAITCVLVFAGLSDAAVYYMGKAGDNFQNLTEAFTGPKRMQGGDTLIIRDGVYSGDSNKIRQFMRPPSGSDDKYTAIKAENSGKVTFNTDISIYNVDSSPMCYWQFEGIRWVGGVFLGYGIHHIKMFRCAFEGNVPDGNTVAFGVTRSAHHILLEDCISYGKGRYKFAAYQASEIIFRRCVARQDYANMNYDPGVATEPIAVFVIYDSSNVECQNCISIDADQPKFWQNPPTEFGGSFYEAGASSNVKWRGCISLNVAMGGSFDTQYCKDILIDNCVFWHQIWGVGSKPSQRMVVRHCTVGDLRTTDDMGLSEAQIHRVSILRPGTGMGSHYIGFLTENNIITGAYFYALNWISLSNRNCLWGNANKYLDVGSFRDDITNINPFEDSLKYLPRIEANSSLYGKATDGGDIGANILKRIGRSGTLYGEPGYDTVTEENLWPWQYEDWIKEQMGNYNKGGVDPDLPRGDRGFAAGKSLDGSPQTLTRYIWEYLGNKIPSEIYSSQNHNGTPADTTKPGVITDLTAITGTAPGSVNLNWTAAGDDGDTGKASSYIIKYADVPITTDNWDSSYSVDNEPLPGPRGTAEKFTVPGLVEGQTYYFAIRARDRAGNISDISNIPNAAALADPVGSKTVVFQNGFADYNNCETNNLLTSSGGTNNGSAPYIIMDNTDDVKYGMVKFGNIIGGKGGIPEGSTILSAKLGLYQIIGYNSIGSMNLFRFSVNPVYGSSWGEINDEADESCWDYLAYDEMRWGNNTQFGPRGGVDYDIVVESKISWSSVPGPRWLEISITDLVQKWVNGIPNNGVLLIPDRGTYTRFGSAQWGTAPERPKITIKYIKKVSELLGQPGKPIHVNE